MTAKKMKQPLIKLDPLLPSEQESVKHIKSQACVNKDFFQATEGTDTCNNIEPIYAKNLSPEEAEEEFRTRISIATGVTSYDVGISLLAGACEATAKTDDSFSKLVRHLNVITKSMQQFEPRDEVEGQLLAQLLVLHQQTMSWLGRAQRTTQADFANTYLNGASKLLVRHHETLDALMKYRRGGEQRVYVEHVHVNDGGRAIIGNVAPGEKQKTEEGPHAKV